MIKMDDLEESDGKHSSIIIHIDVDHFYSQVEEVLNPEIKDKPVGILQRAHIVTCNYHGEFFLQLTSFPPFHFRVPHFPRFN